MNNDDAAVVASSSSMSPVAELVGEFDHGLEGGIWSPDGEVLALFTYIDNDDDDEYDHDDENKVSDDGSFVDVDNSNKNGHSIGGDGKNGDGGRRARRNMGRRLVRHPRRRRRRCRWRRMSEGTSSRRLVRSSPSH